MLSTCMVAREAGFTCKEAREAGMLSTCKDAKAAGFTALKEAGFTCKDAKEAGFKAGKECYQAGFTFEEGKAAGFPSLYRATNGSYYCDWVDYFGWFVSPPPRIRTQVAPCHRAPLRLASIAAAATPCRRACGPPIPSRSS